MVYLAEWTVNGLALSEGCRSLTLKYVFFFAVEWIVTHCDSRVESSCGFHFLPSMLVSLSFTLVSHVAPNPDSPRLSVQRLQHWALAAPLTRISASLPYCRLGSHLQSEAVGRLSEALPSAVLESHNPRVSTVRGQAFL